MSESISDKAAELDLLYSVRLSPGSSPLLRIVVPKVTVESCEEEKKQYREHMVKVTAFTEYAFKKFSQEGYCRELRFSYPTKL